MDKFISILKKCYLLGVLLLFILVFAILAPSFFTVRNLTNVFIQNSYVIIASVGIAIIMIGGGCDLSVSWQMGLVSVVVAKLMENAGWSVHAAVIAGLMLGALLGFVNGTLASVLRVHSMVATLATMTGFQGVTYLVSQSKSFNNLPTGFKAIGQEYIGGVIPICVIIMVVMVALAMWLLNKTYWGRYIYAIGGNPDAARTAGINVQALRLASFMVSGVFVAISSIVVTARTGSATATIGGDAVFVCITACVLGGISFVNGGGRVLNVVIAVLILGVLSNGMQLIGMGIYPQYIAKGIILALAIAFDQYQSRAKVRKASIAVKATE